MIGAANIPAVGTRQPDVFSPTTRTRAPKIRARRQTLKTRLAREPRSADQPHSGIKLGRKDRCAIFVVKDTKMHFKFTLSLAVVQQFFLVLCAQSTPPHGSATPVLESDNDKAWVTYKKNEGSSFVSVSKVSSLLHYISLQPNFTAAGQRARLMTITSEQMEDGPPKMDSTMRTNNDREGFAEGTAEDDGVLTASSINFYPEFAVGILENGCTAFLIGPRHALTTAHCVYNSNTSSFNEDLNFWRGRNGKMYLQHMVWSQVIVPFSYVVSGSKSDNWALIIYKRHSVSPVWLKIGFSRRIYNVPYTVDFYHDTKAYGTLYSVKCRSQAENTTNAPNPKVTTIRCRTEERFNGAPLLRGTNFRRSMMPEVYGIVFGDTTSTVLHESIVFQPDLFWSLCYHMSATGFDAKGNIVE